MSVLDFKGKSAVYAHHLNVPYRPLNVVRKKSVLPPGTDGKEGNLIIHGDNLDALKALLPRYAERVNCIYIDPPYNTGNENWRYNDNVNSELMQRWLQENGAVDGEDEERHEKWLCMMWPRLQLLRRLLAEDGVIFISIDDNEQHRLRLMMDEIFGEENFIACLPTIMNLKGNNDEFGFAGTHEYTLVWAKNKQATWLGEFELQDEDLDGWQQDERGYYKKGATLKATGANAPREKRPNLYYPIFVNQNNEVRVVENNKKPDGYEAVYPAIDDKERPGRKIKMSWRWSKTKVAQTPGDIIVERVRGEIRLYKKQRPELGDMLTRKPKTVFYKPEYSSGNGTRELEAIFGKKVMENPKPLALLKDIVAIGAPRDAVVLDSFAGSGATAHAVLDLNQEDGGNRRFILVECEDYADTVTAGRVRRVIKGVPRARAEKLKQGLGGTFAFCVLGAEINIENLLDGKELPDYDAMARHVTYTATGATLDRIKQGKYHLFGETAGQCLHLIYRPELEFLRSRDSALTRDLAERIGAAAQRKGKTALVFAPWNFISQKDLAAARVTFCRLPYAVHQLYEF